MASIGYTTKARAPAWPAVLWGVVRELLAILFALLSHNNFVVVGVCPMHPSSECCAL